MNQNAEIIFMLCSHLIVNEEFKPLEPSEWSRLAEKLMQANLQPLDIPNMTDSDFQQLEIKFDDVKRIRQLISHGANLVFEFEKYENMGIFVITRADAQYPRILKSRLGKSCPPLFYYAGNLSLAKRKSIGFAGSRNITQADRDFTEQIVSVVNSQGYSVVSGGANGVDTVASNASIQNGSDSVSYIADSMVKRLRNRDTVSAIQNGKLLLLSAVRPDMGFTAATAMMRNRYIYAQSAGTVVVRADYQKGGTWSGAEDCLKRKICPVFCWDNSEYPGNEGLIRLGATPISENWDADITNIPSKKEAVQLSLFD